MTSWTSVQDMHWQPSNHHQNPGSCKSEISASSMVSPIPSVFLTILHKKETFKKLAKSRVSDFWEKKLRAESSSLDSLQFFKPDFMSLTKPHQLWLSAGSNPYEVSKAVIQGRFLSARYRSEELCRHWSANVNGFCKTGSCTNVVESIEHILITCPTFSVTCDRLKMLWLTSSNPVIRDIASKALSGPSQLLLQFLLDCIYQLWFPQHNTMTREYSTLYSTWQGSCASLFIEK